MDISSFGTLDLREIFKYVGNISNEITYDKAGQIIQIGFCLLLEESNKN